MFARRLHDLCSQCAEAKLVSLHFCWHTFWLCIVHKYIVALLMIMCIVDAVLGFNVDRGRRIGSDGFFLSISSPRFKIELDTN